MDYSLDLYTYRVSCTVGGADHNVMPDLQSSLNTPPKIPSPPILYSSSWREGLPLFPSFLIPPSPVRTAMAPKAAVYVALGLACLCALAGRCAASAPGSLSGLLPPYDEQYYLGVRAYFQEEWEKAAEHFEKSLSTRQALHKTRRRCHDQCSTAGDEIASKLATERGGSWDLWALDWIQRRAECIRFCLGQAVTPAGQLPVSTDIEYEFGTRNPYNFLQVTYFNLDKLQKAAAAAHTFFVANPSHLEMRNNIEKYRRMSGITEDAFQDRERELEKHWVGRGEADTHTDGEFYDAAILAESTSDWTRAVERWKECVNETLRQTEDCRAQCVVASQRFPEETESTEGVYEKAAAGDLKGAVHTLRSLLLFYPTDADSLNNLQLYSESLGGDAEAQDTGPSQEIASYVSRALAEKKLIYFGVENLDFKFSDPDLWTPEDIVPESLRESWRAEREQLNERLKDGEKQLEPHPHAFSLTRTPSASPTHLQPHPHALSPIRTPSAPSARLQPHPHAFSLTHTPSASPTRLQPHPHAFSPIRTPSAPSTRLQPHPQAFSPIHTPSASPARLQPHPHAFSLTRTPSAPSTRLQPQPHPHAFSLTHTPSAPSTRPQPHPHAFSLTRTPSAPSTRLQPHPHPLSSIHTPSASPSRLQPQPHPHAFSLSPIHTPSASAPSTRLQPQPHPHALSLTHILCIAHALRQLYLSLSPGGPIPLVGVKVAMDDQALNGTNRVVLDEVLFESECAAVMRLASVAAAVGDGYKGRRSPHTPHEKFEGLTVLRALKLAQDGVVNQSDARLLHEIGERTRTLLHSYFRSHAALYFSYTHLVCRSAIPGHQEGRLDLSHPVHVDNCILEPETRQCWREPPAFIHRDLSAILYLNEDFEGGELFFTDRDAKTVTARVKPSCGRLVAFTSGPVNPHGVTAVTAGRRCALALWFTTEKHHRDMEREEAEAIWAADGQSVVQEEKEDPDSKLAPARSGRSQISKGRSKERERVTGGRDEL
ncbi:hypothetical protein NFI96_031576 [Prochilodus magdalenae]|nr:hypothetical protein NFI96_031576 [Prochilodus magdalenae]